MQSSIKRKFTELVLEDLENPADLRKLDDTLVCLDEIQRDKGYRSGYGPLCDRKICYRVQYHSGIENIRARRKIGHARIFISRKENTSSADSPVLFY